MDMISMSLGFENRISALQEVIELAFQRRVTIFVATSNSGGNNDIAFPASEFEMVVGVNSTDPWGRWSKFSPPRLQLSENFCTLGEAIESSWPSHLGQGTKQRRSGTSYATPIATGFAATLLYIARLTIDDSDKLKALRSCSRIKALLRSISKRLENGQHYLRWLYWKEDPEDITRLILKVLRKLTID